MNDIVVRSQAFTDEMRRQGIHVGFGSPPKCVICGVWPCGQGQYRAMAVNVGGSAVTAEEYLSVLAQATAAIDELAGASVDWEPDDRLDAWDQLDRLRDTLAILIRDHATALGALLGQEYIHPRAGLVHTETEYTTAWDGEGVLEAMSRPMADTATGELVAAVPTSILRDAIPAVKQGSTSSRWNITGLAAAGLDPDKYRRVTWGSRLVKRGPKRSGRKPPEA